MAPDLYVLDTSAILAVLEEEPEAPNVVELLDRAGREEATVLLPFLALMEVEYILLRRVAPERAASLMSLLESSHVRVVESNVDWRREAARIKAGGGLSMADAWMAALAMLSDAELVHKDPEFEKVAGLRSMKL